MEEEDDDDEFFEGIYVDGHWEWDNINEELVFISQAISKEDSLLKIFGPIEFKDDIDLMEQQKFKKRYQRKSEGDTDVVTLQDVKDIVLFTAPSSLLNISLINILHLGNTERFLRALIMYCQYFIQISDEMSHRVLDLEHKVHTPASTEKEIEFRDNLQDLRLLVTKEYCTMILGGGDYKKYHHMGVLKVQSLTRKDSMLFESLVRISVQIVFVALGRKFFNVIEMEVNRIFKSHFYNIIEHKRPFQSIDNKSPQERSVLYGSCLNRSHSLLVHSPLVNEISCQGNREIDYRILGLGILKQRHLGSRLTHLERALITPEIYLQKYSITLGIIGLRRLRFDIMLREIKFVPANASCSSIRSSTPKMQKRMSRASNASRKSGIAFPPPALYSDINLPKKHDIVEIPERFPVAMHRKTGICSNIQRKKWLARLARLTAAKHGTKTRRKLDRTIKIA